MSNPSAALSPAATQALEFALKRRIEADAKAVDNVNTCFVELKQALEEFFTGHKTTMAIAADMGLTPFTDLGKKYGKEIKPYFDFGLTRDFVENHSGYVNPYGSDAHEYVDGYNKQKPEVAEALKRNADAINRALHINRVLHFDAQAEQPDVKDFDTTQRDRLVRSIKDAQRGATQDDDDGGYIVPLEVAEEILAAHDKVKLQDAALQISKQIKPLAIEHRIVGASDISGRPLIDAIAKALQKYGPETVAVVSWTKKGE